MANTRVAPLNVDQRMWALAECARLEKENADLLEQIEKLKQQLAGIIKPPGSGTEPEPTPYKPGEGDV